MLPHKHTYCSSQFCLHIVKLGGYALLTKLSVREIFYIAMHWPRNLITADLSYPAKYISIHS